MFHMAGKPLNHTSSVSWSVRANHKALVIKMSPAIAMVTRGSTT